MAARAAAAAAAGRGGDDSAGEMRRDFARNLRLVCGYEPSVSEVCRRLGVNRTQFDRYLRGAARPSPFVLNRLCDHFGVEAGEFHLPHAAFAGLVALRRRPPDPARPPPYAGVVDRMRGASLPALRAYLGYWRVTYASMSFPGMLVRALSHLFARGPDVYHRRIERLPAPAGGTFRCRYAGVALYLEDRIFLLDAETLTRNEVTHTVLYPTRRSRITPLTGLVAGVSAAHERRIAASRVVFEPLGASVDRRAALAGCGLCAPDSPEVPPAIRDAVDNGRRRDEPLFYALGL